MRAKYAMWLLAAILAAGLVASACSKQTQPSEPVPSAPSESGSGSTEGSSAGSSSSSTSSTEPATPPQPSDNAGGSAQASGGGDPAKGQKIFAEKCAVCHGANGEGAVGPGFISNAKVTTGATGDATKAVKDRLTEEEHINVVTNGRNAMPAWKGQLSEQEIRDVVAYERSFK